MWDGLGLSNAHSGVGQAAACLRQEMVKLGVIPFVTMTARDPVMMCPPERRLIVNKSGARLLPDKIQRLKPVFPVLSYRAAQSLSSRVIFHGLSNINLPCYGALRSTDRFVLTVHDLIPALTAPESMLARQMAWLLPRALKRADAVIAISNWTRDLICERYGRNLDSKISVINNGTFYSAMKSDVPKKHDILVVARGEAYKRLGLICQISRLLSDRQFAVVTDDAGAKYFNHRGSNVQVFKSVSDDALDELFQASKLLLHTSLYEGWCLPAANALSKGLHVVYTAGSGIDEVCGLSPDMVTGVSREAAASEWAKHVLTALDQSKFGAPLLNLPTWADAAQKTLRIYQSLV